MSKKTWIGAIALAAAAAVVLTGCSGGGGGSDSGNGSELTILIGSSGPAETKAVQDAADTWAADNDAKVKVIAADDLNQQLSQGFAGDDAPDLFYMAWDQFANYAGNGYLDTYAKDLKNAKDFYPSLVDTFTFDGDFVCAPKDFSTLGLIVNTDMWAAAGLTDADVPTDWDSLEAVAKKLTTGDTVGLSFGLEYARLGVFMNQAGGTLVDKDGTKATADSPENLAGLEYVQKLHDEGVLKFPSELDAGWGGEALGAGKAAMVIEGPWIKGIASDYPDTKWAAYELPAGPEGKSTFTFTNCWGIPANSDTRDAAVSLVEYLTSDDQQLAFADAFGVIPSTESAAASYAEKYPDYASFVASNDYAVSPVNFAGSASVVGDFNASLEGMASGNVDLKGILGTFQEQLQAALDEANG
ncbi:sugar ABC transporter substrate-binding protein [Homoserinibacter gongjuensis]|jgi:multiple sugar transport system substrate-binding protein|uniref:ABC transporter substrate-binding protein n=1 Tax=Homoserinibacter gongjuensis TaxID=1162968 RepID=A0ABQ6JTK9_9MICO|nr:extracellular solute-binding protein [Homoserinibacter gongjuensis]GMA90841.1 ABC transporter substrate-binding protein [Homoserinibacter gongjuensis]